MNYAYNEDKMLEGIRAFRAEQKRKIHEVEIKSCAKVNRKDGCHLHGTTSLHLRHRPYRKSYYTCRLCNATHSRRNYLKNREKILNHKREYRRKLRQAA